MIVALLLAGLTPLRFVSSDVEKPAVGTGVSTSFDTKGRGDARKAQTALGAERAFAADAQRLGQWTAFRKWAAPDAIMFVPQPIHAQAWLKGRADPPHAIAWQPGASYVACDGKWAVNTGPWQRADGSVGYFTTIWYKERRGWRWLLDSGDALPAPRAGVARPVTRHAACGGATNNGFGHGIGGSGYGASGDATLRWHWHVAPDGARTLFADLWNGKTYDTIVDDTIAAE